MARFHSRSSSKSSRQNKRRGNRKKKSKTSVKFRTGVPAELVDHLLKQFVQTVRTGLALILSEPSELTGKVLKQNPLWAVSPDLNLVLLTWAAFAAWDKPWVEFCQLVLSNRQWQALLAASDQATLEQRQAQFDQVVPRLVELAVHDALKEKDKQDNRPTADKRPVETEFEQDIGVAEVIKRLKKRIKVMLKRLDKADKRKRHRRRPAHRPRDYLTRSFVLADLVRWLLHLPSTDALVRKLNKYAHLAGAVNFEPGQIPHKSTFSRRRSVLPLEELLTILHELVNILVKLGGIDGQAWVIDLTRVPTHSSIKKDYPDRPNNKSDPDAEFCGYRDNDDALQLGYSLLFLIDFKSELPFACLFANGSANDGPLAEPTLQQALDEHPDLAARCTYVLADGSYDRLDFFFFVLNKLKAMPVVTKNPRNATNPEDDLATDTLALLRRPSQIHQTLFNCRSAVERTNSRAKLTFNLKYHKHRGWQAVLRCCLLSTIAMLTAALVALETGHPDKVRKAWTWIELF
jgi:hypothetical protein